MGVASAFKWVSTIWCIATPLFTVDIWCWFDAFSDVIVIVSCINASWVIV